MQEAFDAMVAHLRNQGEPSLDEELERAVYRNANGLKCAIGVLISDEYYDPAFDQNGGLDVMKPEVQSALAKSGVPVDSWAMDMLARMQRVHDDWEPDMWEGEFSEVAKAYGLKFKKV